MNHEILFRGKRVDNGKWIEGYYVPLGDKYHYILTGKLTITNNFPEFEHFIVIPETRGQYTGLTDKNGVKIFEGDIVKHEETTYEVKYATKQARFLAVLSNGVFNPAVFQNCEVVGNAYDNPELLGGEDENDT